MNIIDEHYIRRNSFPMRTSAMDTPDTISACVPPAPNPLRDSPKSDGNFKKRILSSMHAQSEKRKARVVVERLEDALRHTAHLVPRSNGSYTVFPCGQGQTTRDQGQITREQGQTTRDQGKTTRNQDQTTQNQGQSVLGKAKVAQSPVGGVDNSCLPARPINTSTPEPQLRSRVASLSPRVATPADEVAPYLSNSFDLREEVCETTSPSDVTTIHVPHDENISDNTTIHTPQCQNISEDPIIHTPQYENISDVTTNNEPQNENCNAVTTIHAPHYEDISDDEGHESHSEVPDSYIPPSPSGGSSVEERVTPAGQPEGSNIEERVTHAGAPEGSSVEDRVTPSRSPEGSSVEEKVMPTGAPEGSSIEDRVAPSSPQEGSSVEERVTPSGPSGGSSIDERVTPASPPEGSSVEERVTPSGPPDGSSVEERVPPARSPASSSVEERLTPASPPRGSSVEERVTPADPIEGSSVEGATPTNPPAGSCVEEEATPASSPGGSSFEERIAPVEERVMPADPSGGSSVGVRVTSANPPEDSCVEERVIPADPSGGSSVGERVTSANPPEDSCVEERVMHANPPGRSSVAGSLRGRRESAPELRQHTTADLVIPVAGKRGVRSTSLSPPVTDGMSAGEGNARGVTKLKLSRCKDRSWTVVQQVLSESDTDTDIDMDVVPTTPKLEPTVVEATESNSDEDNSANVGLLSPIDLTVMEATESHSDGDNRHRIHPTEPIVIQATVTAVLIDNGTDWTREKSSISPATDDASHLLGTRQSLLVLSEAGDASDDPTEIDGASEVVSVLPLDCSVPLLCSGDTRQVCVDSDSKHHSKCSDFSEQTELKPVLLERERDRVSGMAIIEVSRPMPSPRVNILDSSLQLTRSEIAGVVEPKHSRHIIETSVPLTHCEITGAVEPRSRTTLARSKLSAEAGMPSLGKMDSRLRAESRDQLTECVSETACMATTCDRVSEGGQLTECVSEMVNKETTCDKTSTLEATQGVVRKGRGRPPKSKNKVPPVDKPRPKSKKNSRKSFRHDSIQTFKPTPQVIPTPPWRYKARPHLTSPDVAAMLLNRKTPASSRDSETSTDEPSVEVSLVDGESVEPATDASGPARRTSTESRAPARRVSTEAGASTRRVSVEARGPARRVSAETTEETGRGKSGSSEVMSDSSAKSSECSRSEDGEEGKRKKRKKETTCVMREVNNQFVVAQMQEKGRRLAQEIPRFNWLEEKIRNGGVSTPPKRKLSVPSKATPATEETKPVETLGLPHARCSVIPLGPTDTTTPPLGLSHAATGLRSFRIFSDDSVPPVACGGAVPCDGVARHTGLQQLANDTGLTITLMPPICLTPPLGRVRGGLVEDRNSKQRLLRPRPPSNTEMNAVPHPIKVWGFSDHVDTMARHSATSFDTGLGVSEAFPGPVEISLGPVGASLGPIQPGAYPGPLEPRSPQANPPSPCHLQASRSRTEDLRDGPLRPTPYYVGYRDSPVGRGEQHAIPRKSSASSGSTSSTPQEKELQIMIAESDSLKSMASAYESQLRLRRQESEFRDQLRQGREYEERLRHKKESEEKLRQFNEAQARMKKNAELAMSVRQENGSAARLRQENEQEARLHQERQRELAARLRQENEATARSHPRERQDWLGEDARLSLREERVVAESRQIRSDVNGQVDHAQKSRMDEKQKDLQPVCARPAVPSATAAAISRLPHSDPRWPPTQPPAWPTRNYRSNPHPHDSPDTPLHHSPASAQSSPNSVRSQQQSPQQRLLPHTTVTQQLSSGAVVTHQLLSGAVVTHQLSPTAVIVPHQSPVDISQRQPPRHHPQSPVNISQRQLPRQSPVDISQRQPARHHPQSPGDISQRQLSRSVGSHQLSSLVASVRPLLNEESTRTGNISLPAAAQHRQAQEGFRDLPPEQREVDARFLGGVQNRGMDSAVAGPRAAWRLPSDSNLPQFTRYAHTQDVGPVRSSREKQDAQPVRIQPYPTAHQQMHLRMLQERQLEQLQQQQLQAVLLSRDTNQLWLAQQSRRQQAQHHKDQQQLGYVDMQQHRNNAPRAADPRLQDAERDAAMKARHLHEGNSRSNQGFREPQTMAGANRQHSLNQEMYLSQSQADDVRRKYGEGYIATRHEFPRGVLRNPELSVEPARANRELLGGGSVQVTVESEQYRLARMQGASTVNHRSNAQPNGEPDQFYRYPRKQEETFRVMPVEMAAQYSQREDWPIRPTPLAAQEAQRFVIHEQLRRDRAVQSEQLHQTRSVQSEQLHRTRSVLSKQLDQTHNHIIASPKAKDPQGNVRPLMTEYSNPRINREQRSIEDERDKLQLLEVRNLPENDRLRASICGTGISNGRVQQTRPESIQKHALLPSNMPLPIIAHPHKVIINITTANTELFNNNGSSKNVCQENIHGDASRVEKHTMMATISPNDRRSLTPIESPTTVTKSSTQLKSDPPSNIDKLTDDPDVEELAIDLSMPKRKTTDVQHSTSKKLCSEANLSSTNVHLAAENVRDDTSNELYKSRPETISSLELIMEKPLSEKLTNGGPNETGEEVNQEGRLMMDVDDDIKSEVSASDESLNPTDTVLTEGVPSQGMLPKSESSLTLPTDKPRDLAPSSPVNVIRLACTQPGPETRNYYNNRLHVTPVHDALRRQPGAVRRVSSEMQLDLATRQQLQANQSQVSVTKQTAQQPPIMPQCDVGVSSVGEQRKLPETRANACRNDKPVMQATSQIVQHSSSSEHSAHTVLDNGSSVILSHVEHSLTEHSAEQLSQGQQSSVSSTHTETESPSQHRADVEQTVIKSPSHRPTMNRGSLPTQAGGQLTALHLSEPSLSPPNSSRANTGGKKSVSVPVIEYGRSVGQNLQLPSTEMLPTRDYEVRIQSLPKSGDSNVPSTQFVEPGRRMETSFRIVQPDSRIGQPDDPGRRIMNPELGSRIDKPVDPGRRMEVAFRTVLPGSRIEQTVNPGRRILNAELGSRIDQTVDPGRRMEASFRTAQSGSRIDQTLNPGHRMVNPEPGSRINQPEDPGRRMEASFSTEQPGSRIGQPLRHVQRDSEMVRHMVHMDHGNRMVPLPRNVVEGARVELPSRSMKPPENNAHPGMRPRQPQLSYSSRMEPPTRNGHPESRTELPLWNLEPSSRMEHPQTTMGVRTTMAQPQNPNEARSSTIDRPQRSVDRRNTTEQSHWPLEPERGFERPQNSMERRSVVDGPQTLRVHRNTMGHYQNAVETRTTIERYQNAVEPRTNVESRQRSVDPRNTFEQPRWPVESRPTVERPVEHWKEPTQWSMNPASMMDRPQNPMDRGSMMDRSKRPRDQATVMQGPPWTGGRSMARDISPLAAESPGLHCPDPPAVRLDACCNCSRKAEFMCSSCRVERYCSTQCQMERWLVHNTECGQLAQSNWVN